MDPEKARRYDEARAQGLSHEQAVEAAEGGGAEGPGRMASFGRGVAQGATLGFADEATSALKALPRLMPGGESFGEKYGEEITESRAEDQAARESHPGFMMAGELAGAVAPALATGGTALAGRGAVAAGSRVAPTIGKLALQGAGLGALDAAGRAEGSVVDRLPEAGVGAVAGGMMGAALPFIGKGMARAGTSLGLRMRPAPTRAADEILDALGGSTQGARRGLTGTAGETLMDVAPGARALGETAALYPGAREAIEAPLEARAASQFGDVQNAIEAGTGFRREGASRAAQRIIQERGEAAAEAFPRAYARGPVQVTPELAQWLAKPSVQQAYVEAGRIAAEQGVPLAPLTNPDVRTLHLLKMGLDDVVSKGKLPGEGGLGPSLRFQYDQTRRGLLGEIRRVAPELSDALDEYSGDTSMAEALEWGRTRFHLDAPDELAMVMDAMTPGEVEMARRGMVDNVLHRLGSVTDPSGRIRQLQAPNEVMRLALLFDDPTDFSRFVGALDQQNITRGTVLRGSPTARRLTGREALEGQGAGSSFSLRSLLDEVASGRRQSVGESTARELASMLTKTGADLPTLLDLLDNRAVTRGRTRQVPGAITRLGAIGAGGGLSDLFFDEENR